MPEFIGRPRESQLAALIASMQARRSDPIAQGILQAGQAIGGGIAKRGENIREDERTRLASESAAKLRRESGIMELSGRGGQFVGPEGKPMSLTELLPSLGLPAGATYAPKPEKDGSLNDAEMALIADHIGVEPAKLKGVRLDAVRAIIPQSFIDPETGRVTQAPKGAKVLPATKPPTEGERLTRGFADRAQQAGDELSALMKGGYDPSALFSTRGEWVPNVAKNEKDQQAEQAMRNFVSAVLRKESGAAIPPAELATETLKYFPMRGDKPGVVAQKERARQQAVKNLVAGAGKAPSTYKKPSDTITIIDSEGKEHQILASNIEAAKKRDPGLKVKE